MKKEGIVMSKKESPAVPTNDMVTVQLHKDTGKCSQPITVTINGVSKVVPRGVPVLVSRDVADVLEMKAMQDNNTVDLITGLVDDFKEATQDMDK